MCGKTLHVCYDVPNRNYDCSAQSIRKSLQENAVLGSALEIRNPQTTLFCVALPQRDLSAAAVLILCSTMAAATKNVNRFLFNGGRELCTQTCHFKRIKPIYLKLSHVAPPLVATPLYDILLTSF